MVLGSEYRHAARTTSLLNAALPPVHSGVVGTSCVEVSVRILDIAINKPDFAIGLCDDSGGPFQPGEGVEFTSEI